MTDKEKAKAYDRAIERVKKLYGNRITEEIFPEIKESQDKKIREAILNGLIDCRDAPDLGWSNFGGIHIDDCITWLEKQGENSTNKIKPRFKVGDWVIQGCNILKIRCVGNKYYYFETVGGYVDDMLVSEIDSLYHLWTIQDTKDGDVLAFDNDTIVIFKDLYNSESFHSYCHIEDGIFGFSEDKSPDWWNGEGFKPATKEQRDILMKAINDSGYEWDAEKKELKKKKK